MKIFRKNLFNETTMNYGVVLFMTIGIFAVVKFLGLLKRAVQGSLPVDGLGLILMLKVATFLDVILTPALYISILLVMIRWNRDNEITAYATAGIGPMAYFTPALLVAALSTFLVALCSFVVAPSAEMAYQDKVTNYRHSLRNIPFEEGRFRDFRGGRSVVYFGETNNVEPSSAETAPSDPVRLFYVVSEPHGKEITVAQDGQYHLDLNEKMETLQVINGIRYRISEKLRNYELTEFKSFTESIPIIEYELGSTVTRAKPTLQLIGSDLPGDIAELEWRISKVIVMPMVVLLAFAFGSSRLTSRMGANLVGAVLVYFIYGSLVGFIVDIERTQYFGIDVFLWLPHVLVALLIGWVVLRTHQNRGIIST
ncbi:MAG: LptF/LptG family permease [Acidiferrobacterales bacterium]|nr:LptF/LptG family permease [Acidiferrobacterales bacterium]